MRTVVVLSAFNEEKTIREMVDRSRRFCDRVIVMVSKKSSDSTAEIAEEIGCEVYRDGGKGDGASIAVDKCDDDDIIVFMDADGSHIPEDLPLLTQPLKSGKAELVLASRFMGGSDELGACLMRTCLTIIISKLINFRYGTRLMDTQNGLKAGKASALKSLNITSKKHNVEMEILMKSLNRGYRVIEVPSRELERKFGQSTLSLYGQGPLFFWTFLKNLL